MKSISPREATRLPLNSTFPQNERITHNQFWPLWGLAWWLPLRRIFANVLQSPSSVYENEKLIKLSYHKCLLFGILYCMKIL